MTSTKIINYRLQCGCLLNKQQKTLSYCRQHKMSVKPVKSKVRSGTITSIEVVHATGIILGTGWIFYHEDYAMDKPVLIDNVGEPMEEGWYTLKITSEHMLAVSADRVQ